MTDNENRFIRSIVDYESIVGKAQQYIKENFDVDSVFDSENYTLKLQINESENSINIISAKAYINSVIDESLIRVIF